MPVDTSIYGNQQQPASPMQNMAQLLQLKALIQNQAAGAQQQELGGLQIEQQKRSLAEDEAYRQAVQASGGDLRAALPAIAQASPTKYIAISTALANQDKAASEHTLALLNVRKAQAENGARILAAVTDQPSYDRARASLGDVIGPKALEAMPEQYDPAAVKQWVASGLSATEQFNQKIKEAEEGRAKQLHPLAVQAAEDKNLGSGLALAGQTVQPISNQTDYDAWRATLPEEIQKRIPVMYSPAAVELVSNMGMNATQRAQVAQNATMNTRLDASAAETRRHNVAMENRPVAGMGGLPGREIKEGTKEFKVAQDLAYGKLPFSMFRTLYAGSKNSDLKTGIYQKAAELNPNFNPAAFEMGLTLAKSPKVAQQLASMDNVIRGVPDLLAISDQASRSKLPLLNSLTIKGGIQLGDKRYSNLHAARVGFADELSGALGFGGATDMSRQMGLDMTDPNLSPEAFRAAIQDVVIPFIERKRASLLTQMGTYGTSQFNPAAKLQEEEENKKTGAGGGGKVSVKAPDGNTYTFKDQKAADAFKTAAGIP